MHHGFDVRSLLVDFQMQQRLAAPLFPARNLLACHIDGADIVGLQKALGMHGRRAQNFVLADADGDIAVVGRSKALGVNTPTNFTNILFDLVCVDHGNPFK